jgi:hypothetical protein
MVSTSCMTAIIIVSPLKGTILIKKTKFYQKNVFYYVSLWIFQPTGGFVNCETVLKCIQSHDLVCYFERSMFWRIICSNMPKICMENTIFVSSKILRHLTKSSSSVRRKQPIRLFCLCAAVRRGCRSKEDVGLLCRIDVLDMYLHSYINWK